MQSVSKQNDNELFNDCLLTAIELFSEYAYTVSLNSNIADVVIGVERPRFRVHQWTLGFSNKIKQHYILSSTNARPMWLNDSILL